LVASVASTRSVRRDDQPMSGGVRRQYLALVRGETRGLSPAAQRAGLWLASVPYGVVVRLRNLVYDSGWSCGDRVGVPVVSVGNLTVGGTGKTPCVEYVGGFYCQRGVRVAILSRGYGAADGPNDEALVLEQNLPDVPHLQGADRTALARVALGPLRSELLVLDDGFQHRRLGRDLDLVLIDATAPWGYGHLLPRGLLREPVSALKRAGVILLTRCDQVGAGVRSDLRRLVAQLAPQAPLVETTHQPVGLTNSAGDDMALTALQSSPVAAFCGVANPEAFRRTLIDLGASLAAFQPYPDHHRYTRRDVEELERWSRALPPRSLIVTTQKDLVKLRRTALGPCPLWSLRIRLRVEAGAEVLTHRLESVLGKERS
jgi:tetraacyldisaccharide 4'-kinase